MAAPADNVFILAIDLGSSGPKVTLFSRQATLVTQASAAVRTHFTSDGGGEQGPDEWWQAITACVRQVMAESGVPPTQVVAISCASQWSVTVPVDRDGKHLMNAVHWTDSRGAKHTRPLIGGLIKVGGYGLWPMFRWVRLTGGIPTHSGADALAHMLFVKHERPDVYERTYKFLEPMDYLNFRLTGRAAASHATIFPYLLTDNRDNTRVTYADSLIRLAGIARDKLPDLLPVGKVLGTLRADAAAEWGLPVTTQVIGGTPDSQAAAVGSGAVRDFDGHVCVGTSAWLSCHVPFKKTNLLDYLATMPSAIYGRNMVTAEQGAAGKCLEGFVDRWLCAADELNPAGRPADVYAKVERLAASVAPGSDGLLFLPWLNGAGPPSGDGLIRGGFLNQTLRTGRAEALRAIVEGVSFNLRWLCNAVEKFAGRRFDTLSFIGRCATSDLWCQTLADVLHRPIRRMRDPQMATSRGAALVGLVALGLIRVEDIPSLVPLEATFHPQSAHVGTYNQLFDAWLRSYKANKPIFHRLNRTRDATADARP